LATIARTDATTAGAGAVAARESADASAAASIAASQADLAATQKVSTAGVGQAEAVRAEAAPAEAVVAAQAEAPEVVATPAAAAVAEAPQVAQVEAQRIIGAETAAAVATAAVMEGAVAEFDAIETSVVETSAVETVTAQDAASKLAATEVVATEVAATEVAAGETTNKVADVTVAEVSGAAQQGLGNPEPIAADAAEQLSEARQIADAPLAAADEAPVSAAELRERAQARFAVFTATFDQRYEAEQARRTESGQTEWPTFAQVAERAQADESLAVKARRAADAAETSVGSLRADYLNGKIDISGSAINADSVEGEVTYERPDTQVIDAQATETKVRELPAASAVDELAELQLRLAEQFTRERETVARNQG
jgi:hypothetical protein